MGLLGAHLFQKNSLELSRFAKTESKCGSVKSCCCGTLYFFWRNFQALDKLVLVKGGNPTYRCNCSTFKREKNSGIPLMDAVLIVVQKGLSSSNCGNRDEARQRGRKLSQMVKKQVF